MSGSTFRSALVVALLLGACDSPSILLTVSREQAPTQNPLLNFCESATDDSCEGGVDAEAKVFPGDGPVTRTFGLFGGHGPVWIKFDYGSTSGPCISIPTDAPDERVRVELLADDTITRTCFPAECGAVETCQ